MILTRLRGGRRRAASRPRRASRPSSGRARAAARARSSRPVSWRSRVKWRSESPDWRAPRSWPSPRISRSRSASSKPSLVATIASRRSRATSVSSSFGPETSRQYDCSAPRPTRPRSWCSWASPKRSASCTIMIVAFGTSTPDLDHRRRDEHVDLARLEGRHDRAALGGLEAPVHAADAEALQLGAPQPLGLVLGGARDGRLGGLDQRADDVGLAAVREMARQPRVRLRAAVVGDPGGHDRLAVGGRRRDLGDREVAVDGQRERARDRRRRHVEHVRAAPLGERGALLDAEAVLLVDDRDREVAEADLLLDQRVRADGDLHVSRRDQLADVRVLLRRRARSSAARRARRARCRCPRS